MKKITLFGFVFCFIISIVLNYILINALILHDWNWINNTWFILPYLKEIAIGYYISVHLYILLVIYITTNKKITL
jgi:hypothetical protein